MKSFIALSLVVAGALCLVLVPFSKAAEKPYTGNAPIVIAKNTQAKSPCAMMSPIRKTAFKDKAQALEYGMKLWQDKTLGTSNMSCSGCHAKGRNLRDKPFPRYVEMTGDVVTLDQMINYCITNPLKGEALKWNSRKLTALTAYVHKLMIKK